jgi:hypothetical protein
MVSGWSLLREPLVALMVAVVVVAEAAVFAKIVTYAVPDPGAAMADRDNVALTPAGSPLIDRPTAELTPTALMLTAIVAVWPRRSDSAVVEGEIVSCGSGGLLLQFLVKMSASTEPSPVTAS